MRIQTLIDEFGSDFDEAISTAARDMDVKTIARFVAIGSGRTVDEVIAESPPVVPTVSAIMEALNVAFHGQKEAPPASDGEANPPRSTSSGKRGGKRTARG